MKLPLLTSSDFPHQLTAKAFLAKETDRIYAQVLAHIHLLKLVKLERVTSASIVPQSDIEKEAGGNLELLDMKMRQNYGGQKDSETFTFRWQQKLFCRREVNHYGDVANCSTVLDRKYHDEVSPYTEKGVARPTKRLFTYVDHDNFTNRDEHVRYMTTSPSEEPTVLAQKMNMVRQRRKAGPRIRDLENAIIPKVNIVDRDPTEESKKVRHILSTPVQTMYIMVDLAPNSRESTEEDERVLCTLKFDSTGVLSIQPDFTKGQKPYRIEASGQGRDAYDYTIVHASKPMSRQEHDRETKMVRELCNRHTEFLSSLVGQEFEMPPPDVLRLCVNGEIVSATNFEYDDLYVHFFVELPNHWYADDQQLLSGVTQTCSTKVIDRDEVAYFSYPFNCDLFYRDDSFDEDRKDLMPTWPQLFLEVLSLDSWHRYRTEGYGYVSLPTAPGIHTLTVNCWRPVGKSCASELRRFFIGGSPEIEDPTYVAVPSTFDGSHLSKYGFTTMSSGSVTVKLNCMQQSQAFLHSAVSKKKIGSLIDRFGTANLHANILQVLDAFQKARSRMLAVRDNLKQEFVETLKANESD